jgi:hypothetical protein
MAILDIVYGSEGWTVTEWQKGRLEPAKMLFMRPTSAYRLFEYRGNVPVREELQTADINSRMKDYQIKLLHLERMEQNRFP